MSPICVTLSRLGLLPGHNDKQRPRRPFWDEPIKSPLGDIFLPFDGGRDREKCRPVVCHLDFGRDEGVVAGLKTTHTNIKETLCWNKWSQVWKPLQMQSLQLNNPEHSHSPGLLQVVVREKPRLDLHSESEKVILGCRLTKSVIIWDPRSVANHFAHSISEKQFESLISIPFDNSTNKVKDVQEKEHSVSEEIIVATKSETMHASEKAIEDSCADKPPSFPPSSLPFSPLSEDGIEIDGRRLAQQYPSSSIVTKNTRENGLVTDAPKVVATLGSRGCNHILLTQSQS
ncbi:uncharacterized protein G2W53_027202 [Senna tora]|uniref:Uncharacterized protein n=1 Tax=Senna tora TaxID=362788 RepID=A0A834TIA7_9FABA|nr:uncharacterized protein G2W53_027202 [Senna tora]